MRTCDNRWGALPGGPGPCVDAKERGGGMDAAGGENLTATPIRCLPGVQAHVEVRWGEEG